jgi:hypothetical protein
MLLKTRTRFKEMQEMLSGTVIYLPKNTVWDTSGRTARASLPKKARVRFALATPFVPFALEKR